MNRAQQVAITAVILLGGAHAALAGNGPGAWTSGGLGGGVQPPVGGGTLNRVVKWTPDGTTLGDACTLDNGTTINGLAGGCIAATQPGTTFQNATATDDQIAIAITTGGATRNVGTITNAQLTASRTYTLPDLSGYAVLGPTALSAGSVLYAASGIVAQDNAAFNWTDATHTLTVGDGTKSGGDGLSISRLGTAQLALNTTGTNNAAVYFASGGTVEALIGWQGAAGQVIVGAAAGAVFKSANQPISFSVTDGASTTMSLTSTGLGIGDATPAALLTVGAGDLFQVSSAGNVSLSNAGTASTLSFFEPSGSGTNYSSFAAVPQVANITYSLPPAVGAANTVLTDVAGNGVLTWAAGPSRDRFDGSIFSAYPDATDFATYAPENNATAIRIRVTSTTPGVGAGSATVILTDGITTKCSVTIACTAAAGTAATATCSSAALTSGTAYGYRFASAGCATNPGISSTVSMTYP